MVVGQLIRHPNAEMDFVKIGAAHRDSKGA